MTRYDKIGWSMVLCAVLAPRLALPALAEQSTMKSCYAEYVANKAKVEARGFTEKDFLADCLLRPAAATVPVAAVAPAAVAPTSAAPAASVAPAASTAPSPTVVPQRRPPVDPALTVLAIVTPNSASPAAAAPLGTFAKKEACLASAKAIRLDLKKATDVAKVDCLAATAFEAARTAQ